MSGAEDVRQAYSVAEAIASRDHNNLYLTSRFFADPRRFDAFCALYAPMRLVDDRVDEIVAVTRPGAEERAEVAAEVAAWAEVVRDVCAGRPPTRRSLGATRAAQAAALATALADAQSRFPIPALLWESFFAAMRRDLAEEGFETFADFLAYAEGATVAPTTIYLILLAADPSPGGRFRLPRDFDVVECGRNLGLFAYLVHILRDLPEDLSAGTRGLSYIAREDMRRHGVDLADLRADLARGEARPQVRRLLAEVAARAQEFLASSEAPIRSLLPRLQPDCAYVLALITELYRELLERLAAVGFDPFRGEHHLGPEEKERLAERVGRRSQLSPSSTG